MCIFYFNIFIKNIDEWINLTHFILQIQPLQVSILISA